jgi:hypothetical protein
VEKKEFSWRDAFAIARKIALTTLSFVRDPSGNSSPADSLHARTPAWTMAGVILTPVCRLGLSVVAGTFVKCPTPCDSVIGRRRDVA